MDESVASPLELPELLRMILVHLDMLDLFVLRRVNSMWQDIICNTDVIRCKMFLEPDPDLTRAAQRILDVYEDETGDLWEEDKSYTWLNDLLLNPVLSTVDGCDSPNFLGRLSTMWDFEPIAAWSTLYALLSDTKEVLDPDEDEKRLLRRDWLWDHDASWRKMRVLAMECPRRIYVDCGYPDQFDLSSINGTMGELVDRLALHKVFSWEQR